MSRNGRWVRRLTPAPLTKRALTFAARNPMSFVATVVAVLLLTGARAAPGLVVDASADRAFAAGVHATPEHVPYNRRIDLRGYATGVADAEVVSKLTEAIDALPVWSPPILALSPQRYELARPRPQPIVRLAGTTGSDATAVLYARTGGTESLTPVGDAPAGTGDGIWLPESVAAQIHATVGNDVELELVDPRDVDDDPETAGDDPSLARTTVLGIYATEADGLPTSTTLDWSSFATDLPAAPNGAEGVAPLMITTIDTMVSLLAEMDDAAAVSWDCQWLGPHTIDRGREAANAVGTLAAHARDPFHPLGAITAEADIQPLNLATGVQRFVEAADETAAALRPLIDAMATAVQIICAAVLAAAAWLLCARRTREVQLQLAHGMHPLRIGALAALEQLAGVVVGAAVALLAVAGVARFVAGEGPVGEAARAASRRAVLTTAPWILVLVFVVWSIAATSIQPTRSAVTRAVGAAFRWEVIVGVLAVVAGFQLSTEADAPRSTSAMLFPILALLAGGALVARLCALASAHLQAHRSRTAAVSTTTARPAHLAWWLCARRITSGIAEGAVLIIIVATGVGMLAYTSSAASAARHGVAAKAAALAGARTTATIPWSGSVTGGEPGIPTALPAGWTILWTDRDVTVGPSLRIDIEAVDPATFATAAEWRPSFADESPQALLARMDALPTNRVGIIVAGARANDVPRSGTMSNDIWTVTFQVVGRVAALPGLADLSTVALIDAHRLFALIPPEQDPTLPAEFRTPDNPDGFFTTRVWSGGEPGDFATQLDAFGLGAVEIGGLAVDRERPDLAAYRWSLPVLRVVGVLALLVACLAMVLHTSRRRQSTTLDVAMMSQMGISARAIRIALGGELVALTVLGCAVGTALAIGLGNFMIARLDPDRRRYPRFVAEWSWWAVAGAVGLSIVVAVAVSALELRACRRARTSEVFRVAE